MSERIDSVNGRVDEPCRLCSDSISTGAQTNGLVDVCNTEAVISWSSIMKACGDENLVKEIVEIFLDDAPRSLELAAGAIEAGDPEGVKLYAHRLKGAARHIAAKELSEEAYRLERASREKDMAIAARLFEQVRDEFEKVVSFLSQSDWIERAKQLENQQTKQNIRQ